MKANITNLKKALKACAKAHKARFNDWREDGQLGIWSVTPGTICDVQLILESFFGNNKAMDISNGIGCITIWLDDSMVRNKRNVDEQMLAMALPYGTKL